MVLQPSTSASNNLLPARLSPGGFFSYGARALSGDVSAVSLPATPVRGGAIVMARQAFETPEGDHAALTTMLADEVLVTELEASALVHMRRRRLLALRADQREMSCTPTLSEMSEPVHVFLLRDPPVPAVWVHQIIITPHAKVEMWDARPFAANVFNYPIVHKEVRQGGPRRLRSRISSPGTEPRFRRQSAPLLRGSPAMNRVPGGASSIIVAGFRNLISHASNWARFRDFRESSSA